MDGAAGAGELSVQLEQGLPDGVDRSIRSGPPARGRLAIGAVHRRLRITDIDGSLEGAVDGGVADGGGSARRPTVAPLALQTPPALHLLGWRILLTAPFTAEGTL